MLMRIAKFLVKTVTLNAMFYNLAQIVAQENQNKIVMKIIVDGLILANMCKSPRYK